MTNKRRVEYRANSLYLRETGKNGTSSKGLIEKLTDMKAGIEKNFN
jgi:hypothetical protein